jgi:1-acyl-sn-glycerol-3-phosphate acyltransferase
MRWYFEYLWRLLGTTLSFIFFGVGGLVYGLVVFPLMFVFIRNPDRRRYLARQAIGHGFAAFTAFMRALGLFTLRIEGREHIDDQRRQLIIANHPTLIDVVILISLFPQANCVIKEAVVRNPFMRSTVRAADYISNRAPEELLESCVEYLTTGNSLLLFPEGTRTSPGESIVFKAGAATVAARTGVDILPIIIECEPHFLSKRQPWHHVPRKVPEFRVRILPPSPVSAFVTRQDDERNCRQELNDALLGLVRKELQDMAFSRKPH